MASLSDQHLSPLTWLGLSWPPVAMASSSHPRWCRNQEAQSNIWGRVLDCTDWCTWGWWWSQLWPTCLPSPFHYSKSKNVACRTTTSAPSSHYCLVYYWMHTCLSNCLSGVRTRYPKRICHNARTKNERSPLWISGPLKVVPALLKHRCAYPSLNTLYQCKLISP